MSKCILVHKLDGEVIVKLFLLYFKKSMYIVETKEQTWKDFGIVKR